MELRISHRLGTGLTMKVFQYLDLEKHLELAALNKASFDYYSDIMLPTPLTLNQTQLNSLYMLFTRDGGMFNCYYTGSALEVILEPSAANNDKALKLNHLDCLLKVLPKIANLTTHFTSYEPGLEQLVNMLATLKFGLLRNII